MRAWWSSLGRVQRIVAVVVALVVGVNLVLAGLGDVVPRSPGGPTSSTFGTGPDGLAAYSDLLERSGHDVTRLRSRLNTADLPPDATVILADPSSLSESEGVALVRFAGAGGRVVLSGVSTGPLVAALTGVRIESVTEERADRIDVWVPTDLTGSAERLEGDEGTRWTDYGPLLPLAGVDGKAALLTAPVGKGRIVALADTGPLRNENLARADNAAFGVALAGHGRPVVFVESVHGFATGGLDAVPSGWKWAAAGLAVALVLGLWAAGTRFGPPEPSARTLRPPRSDYVDAVAATMRNGVAAPGDLVEALVGEETADEVSTLDEAVAVGASKAAERRRQYLRSETGTASATVADRSEPPGDRP
ncbi:MAG: DUF4350 domain-containing protein [Acidimicrobiales bacterium]|nr:DUF4350 domain-containing protein [Acidimicrobiales bacterium]